MTIASCATILLGLLATSVHGDRATGFSFKSASCSTNSVTNFESSCDGDNPCSMGEHAEVSGIYTVGTAVPKQVEICANVQAMSFSLYNAGCQEVNVCDYLDGCSNDDDDIEPGSYPFDFGSKVPGESNSNWIGGGYSFKFVFKATDRESGSEVESCHVVVKASTISSTSAIMALASLCTAAAAVYYRRRRRTAAIDLESEENAIQADFVEMSKAGVSV